MLELPSIPPGTTVFTHTLAGADLDALLDAAERNVWPNSQCLEQWALLRNWAMQTESLMLDEAEDLAWEQQMRELARLDLDYSEWTARRLDALRQRERARKLAQTRLRDKYGYKRPRRWGLISRDVRAFYRRWATEQ